MLFQILLGFLDFTSNQFIQFTSLLSNVFSNFGSHSNFVDDGIIYVVHRTGVPSSQGVFAFEMTCVVSGGALNSTDSLTAHEI